MAAKKKAVKKAKVDDSTIVAKVGSYPIVDSKTIELLPTDFGREDLNTMAAKINEIIEKYG